MAERTIDPVAAGAADAEKAPRNSGDTVAADPADRPGAIDIETRDLSRSVPGRLLVDAVSISVRRGEVLAIIGPSGAGKSSFLRLLNRLDEPTGGTVLFRQQDYREIEPRALRRHVGMVMQAAFLFPGNVRQNLQFGPQQANRQLGEDRISALLERVGLAGYQDHDVATLSGGEAQRVSLARTLANDPQVLLLDEPTSALDEESARSVEQLVLGIVGERQMSCVIVTHNRAQAERIAPRSMYMERGRLVAFGSTAEVLHAH